VKFKERANCFARVEIRKTFPYELARWKSTRRSIGESHRLRQKTKSGSEAKIWSARSAVCSLFPPQNPDSARVRHAERGSKSTVRFKILKFEPIMRFFLKSR